MTSLNLTLRTLKVFLCLGAEAKSWRVESWQRQKEEFADIYETYLFQVVVRRNTNGRLGWGWLYRRQLHPQQCWGHPGMLHLQCTQEKENCTDTAMLWRGVHLRKVYTSVLQSVVSVKRGVAAAMRIWGHSGHLFDQLSDHIENISYTNILSEETLNHNSAIK